MPRSAGALRDKAADMDRLPECISTPRLELRLWTEDDVDALGAAIAASLEHLRPWMPWVEFEPLARADRVALIRTWHEDHRSGRAAVYGVFCDRTVVGGCGLHRRGGPGVLDIGYWIHADHVRRGYAKELARALTDAALAQPGIDRVDIHHDRANVASGAVPRSLGFTFLGERPDAVKAPGEDGVDWCWSTSRRPGLQALSAL
jgi:RimJ/RimL family protein N-acetyltransferase